MDDVAPLPLLLAPTATITNNMGRFLGNKIYPPESSLSTGQQELMQKMMILRNQNIQSRIDALFLEIHYHGIYTDSHWLLQANKTKCVDLFHRYQTFWEGPYLSRSVKWQICSLTGTPFYHIFISNFYEITYETMLEALVIVMENLVFTGSNEEGRHLGAMQVVHLAE
jgi:hypothetical protein